MSHVNRQNMNDSPQKPLHPQNIKVAVVYTIISAVIMTILSSFVKLTGGHVPVAIVIFLRFAIGLLFCIPWAILYPQQIFPITAPFKVLIRSIFSLLSMSCFFLNLHYGSLIDSLLLSSSYPLIIPLIVWIKDRIKTPKTVWGGIILGFIGIMLVLKPDADFFCKGSWFGLIGAVFGAISVVVIRSLTKSVPVAQIIFYNFLIGTIVLGFFVPFQLQHIQLQMIGILVLIGILGTAYQLLSTISFSKAPVRFTSPLMYLCIPFGAILDYYLWHQIPDFWSLIGIVFVMVGGIITIFAGQKEIKEENKNYPLP